MRSAAPLKPAALGQISRCRNCSRAYPRTDSAYEWHECEYDALADQNYTVPCTRTPSRQFDFMGLSVRTPEWRYSTFCAWDGPRLAPDWSRCSSVELFDHRGDTPRWDADTEHANLAGQPQLADVERALRARLVAAFNASR